MPDLQYTHPRLAEIYDLGNSGAEDRNFYLSLAGPAPWDILDLGCGTGLLCDAFAAPGHIVVGVDPAAAMLDVARQKPNGARITWVNSTAEAFSTDRKFDLIFMTGHAFQVLLSDDEISTTLRVMAEHLKPGGQAAFESRNPVVDWDSVWAREYTMETTTGPIQATRRLLSAEPGLISFAWDYAFSDETLSSESTLRFLSHAEIVRRATQAGLSLIETLGDWDGSLFAPERSREMIFKFRRTTQES